MTGEELEAEFAARAVPYAGGLLILQPDDALALIRRAEAERIAVLGVDGFVLTERETRSPLEHLADFSGAVARGEGCWETATRFIEQRGDLGLSFEVVLGERVTPAG